MIANRQIAFAARPEGRPAAETFIMREAPMPVPEAGEILCRNLWLSVDPYLRLKMHDRESYTPPLQIGETIPGRSVAEVIEARAHGFSKGDLVAVSGGWQDFAAVPAKAAKLIPLRTPHPTAYLGPLGMTGETAYAGLLQIGKPKPGETLVVSAAAGAVGGLVGQIGKVKGCRVVGIAGSQEKCRFVTEELKFDACVNYRTPDFARALKKACPNGVDIYFDNVGGPVTETVLPLVNTFARMPLCGLISQYDGQQAGDPRALAELMRWILVRRITIRGFIVYDIAPNFPDFEGEMTKWLDEGLVVSREHLSEGFDNIVPAFLGLLGGENTGKSIVRIAEPSSLL
ncbi:NADP-dependent oxidoreductase [Mesorhizobium zhangyense]|uniref:NADP-dependent oxidoreductase n=1 Tax=Mesorhizobium zhangyense TaxID=1776730 RepID=UPI00197C81D5|nr:NADP-dependent oxidoreductase [Mesorhizobium zhangyense]